MHFKDSKRRLYGWAQEWPDDPSSGQVLICYPHWLLPNGEHISSDAIDFIVVAATDVEMVEFFKGSPTECICDDVHSVTESDSDPKEALKDVKRSSETTAATSSTTTRTRSDTAAPTDSETPDHTCTAIEALTGREMIG